MMMHEPWRLETRGLTFVFRPPETFREIAECESLYVARIASRQSSGHMPGVVDVSRLIAWCSHYVESVEGDDGPLDGDMEDILDEELSVGDMLDLKTAIIRAAGLPEETLGPLEEFFYVICEGCECPLCDPPKNGELTPVQRRRAQKACRYSEIPDHIEGLASYWVAIEGTVNLMDEGYHICQLSLAAKKGRAMHRREQKTAQEKGEWLRNKVKEKLKTGRRSRQGR